MDIQVSQLSVSNLSFNLMLNILLKKIKTFITKSIAPSLCFRYPSLSLRYSLPCFIASWVWRSGSPLRSALAEEPSPLAWRFACSGSAPLASEFASLEARRRKRAKPHPACAGRLRRLRLRTLL